MKIPRIYEDRIWTSVGVQRMCIAHNLYTRGDNEAFDKMLNMVAIEKPTTANIYLVAKDILEHSRDNSIENIMFLLSKEAVSRYYEIGSMK